MKVLFVLNGVVIGHGSAFAEGVTVSSGIDGTTNIEVDDTSPVTVGWEYSEVDGVPIFTEPAAEAPKVSPVQFKLLFTAPERVAIKASTDPVVQDFFEIVNDPRLTFVDLGLQSTKDAVAYLASKNLLTEARAAEVLSGVVK